MEKKDGENTDTLNKSEEERSVEVSKEKLEHNFHVQTKEWRKQINHLQSQLVNNREITSLQNVAWVSGPRG